MHVIGYGSHPYPSSLSFGSARIWDMGVTWADLVPNPPSYTCNSTDLLGNCTGYTMTTDGWDSNAVARLDAIVQGYTDNHVEPLLVLGMTPRWAANPNCPKYPARTCAPSATDAASPWGQYVQTLARRYDGYHGHPKVTYFETWNEANLSYGYTDAVETMAAMQGTAYSIIHNSGAGQKLLSASFAFSTGRSWASLTWLDHFLAAAGGTSYDITDLHVYPTVPASKGNYGPEAETNRLMQVRRVLANHGVASRPTWDTETNIGYRYTSTAGAAQVVRTLVLGTESRLARVFWYAADVRDWGVALENSDYKTLTAAGRAYRWASLHLTNARAYGCHRKTVGRNKWNYGCRYHLRNGKNMMVVWTTGRAYKSHLPAGTTYWYGVTGAAHKARRATILTISHTPTYLTGTFKI